MQTKVKVFKNGSASIEKLSPSGMYLVECRIGANVHDKTRCDDYRTALDYFRCFCRIAKNA